MENVWSTKISDYFWREYTGGIIPADAVRGGSDINGQDTYIGQAYIKNRGIIVVQIHSEIREVLVPISGVVKTSQYIKVCNFFFKSCYT